jgi:hypothetical protein
MSEELKGFGATIIFIIVMFLLYALFDNIMDTNFMQRIKYQTYKKCVDEVYYQNWRAGNEENSSYIAVQEMGGPLVGAEKHCKKVFDVY